MQTVRATPADRFVWSNGCSVSGNSVTCAADSLGVNGSVSFILVLRPSIAGSTPNTLSLFTIDADEYAVLPSYGWIQEGTQGYILDNPGSRNGVAAVPYYRLYNGGTLQHRWTADSNEYYLLSYYYGWQAEGANSFLLTAPTTGTVPLWPVLIVSPFTATILGMAWKALVHRLVFR